MTRKLHETAVIYPGAVVLGNVELGAYSILDDFSFLYGPKDSKITIGRRCHVASFVSMSGGSVLLGDYSSIGPGTRLLAASDSFLGDALVGSAVPAKYRKVKRATITLGKHAVVGANCVVMPGVTIGEGACVGANSLVTHDVPPWTIVIGAPARFWKRRPSETVLAMQHELETEEQSA